MNILVTGANGQLGSELKDLTNLVSDATLYFTDRKELDICNFDLLLSYANTNNIRSIINCAAYTDVEGSESEIKLAAKINADAIKNLVKVTQEIEGKLIHISTDYVFDGNSNTPYKEDDFTTPINSYGMSKRKGELEIINSNTNSIVIRTSWLYSYYGLNFVKTMLRLGESKDSLSVIYDQIGTPTYAKDLGKVLLDILLKHDKIDKNGKIYHYSNEGVASWYDFAYEIMEMAKLDCVLKPVLTSDYPETKAKRPHYSVMSKEKIKTDFNVTIPHWKESLKKCLYQLRNK